MNSEWQSLQPQTQQELKNTMNAMQPPQSVGEIKAGLETTEKGGVRQSIRNCLTVFQCDPLLSGAIAYNILTNRKDIIKPIGFHRESTALNDTDMKYLLLYLEETYGLTNEKKIDNAIGIVANENKYHPIRDYGTKIESDSIGNQRMLINRYLDNHPVLSKYPRLEFADDGYTGTNFKRPQFTAMMEKVRHGEINLIIVKDFSRFSRDYIETGNYLECTFPFMGIRFISVNDGYDSEDYKGTTGGLEVVMRSIIYAAYSKDLSVKTTSAKVQMMKQGKYVGGDAPFGYRMHPTKRNALAIDPDSAKIVQRIFEAAVAGSNTSAIAQMLNDEDIPTPGQYFQSKYGDTKKFNYMSKKISWDVAMVLRVLKNQVYTGALVSHRRKSCGVGSRKTVPQEPIIVEGTHEAIISKETFLLAQRVIRRGNHEPRKVSN